MYTSVPDYSQWNCLHCSRFSWTPQLPSMLVILETLNSLLLLFTKVSSIPSIFTCCCLAKTKVSNIGRGGIAVFSLSHIFDLAGRYFIQVIPYVFSFAVAFRIQRFLQAQSKVKVIMCIAFVDLLIQNGLLYIFINVFGWGITGLAMVTNIIGSLCALALVVYTIEIVKIRRITLPVALSQLFQFLTNSSTSIYVGRVGDIELSSISVYHGVISSI
ncbi:hypothetical protein JHK87_045549 [Glycine soja]|nr:hypothetical protein JHK87_045549 [Glycine soja]